ncbi:MAG: FCD domain-containing protein [Actinomycetota bacterium]|nr:FCD domain-containing protein [Actinomycetota bacterium]
MTTHPRGAASTLPHDSRAAVGTPEHESLPDRKLASRLASQIMSDLQASQWAVGTVIGSEAELLERYEVSRAVLREAERLLEHFGATTTKRGPGGGLIVAEPSTGAVVQAVMVYLTYTDVSLGDLMAARTCIERTVARAATLHATEEQVNALRQRVHTDKARHELDANDHHVLHTMIAAAANNPAAELFIDVLGRLTARWSYPLVDASGRSEALEASARAHELLVDAITSGNSAMAERRMNAHLTALGDWLGSNRQSPRSLEGVLEPADDLKLGTKVARLIMVDIVERGWPIGEILGSESRLIEQYGVSRAALREAVRLLEYLRVATMKPGPRGGLIVTEPSVEPIIEAASVFLEYRHIEARHLIDLRIGLESDAIALVVERATDADIHGLRTLTADATRVHYEGSVADDLHLRIADLSGNPAIALFLRVLVHLTRLHAPGSSIPEPRRSAIHAESGHAHDGIVDAIAARDVALARRRMMKHLELMPPVLR